MKKFLILIFCVFSLSQLVNSQDCPSGSVFFSYQYEVDNFIINYPDCSEITGNLGFTNVNNITNLQGLINIESISGNLTFEGCSSIQTLEGLNNLQSIGGNLEVSWNSGLQNLSGLNNLTTVDGTCNIFLNMGLESLEGLGSLVTVGDHFSIVEVNGITNLSGLTSLNNIGGNFNIVSNPSLINFEGLVSLETIYEDLYIGDNPSLLNLEGLSKIQSVNGSFHIIDNPSLESIDMLLSLEEIGGELGFRGNHQLVSLEGINNIDPNTIEDLTIYNNNMLSECHVESVCAYLVSPNGGINIQNNGTGCANKAQVEHACVMYTDESFYRASNLAFPNPAINELNLYSIVNEDVKNVSLFNSLGQKVFSSNEYIEKIDVSNYPEGVYLLQLITSTSNLEQVIIIAK